MTLQEFKAWFEGYTECMEDRPTEKQWARIKERVSRIDGVQTTIHHYHDRYSPYWSVIGMPQYMSSTIQTGNNAVIPANAFQAIGTTDYQTDTVTA